MPKRRNNKPPSSSEPEDPKRPRGTKSAGGTLVLVTLLLTAAFFAARQKPDSPVTRDDQPASTNGAASTASASPSTYKLIGKWVRPDGGYVLEIRGVESSGRMDAGYFNPSPINISRAEAKQSPTNLTAFVELQDANYPGCTYRLTYNPQRDALEGTYFQAALQQDYQIEFVRLP